MDLPLPHLSVEHGVVWVPAFTALKLHDITDGLDDPNREALDMNAPAGSDGFFRGSSRFLRASSGGRPMSHSFHRGMFTTLRGAVLSHSGEAAFSRTAFNPLPADERNALIDFLKSLQVVPPGNALLVVDERGRPRTWKSTF